MFQQPLRHLAVTAGLLGAVVPLAAQETLAASHLDFNVHNQTSTSIVELYVSNSSHPTWEEDVTGAGTLSSGASTRINFDSSHQGCFYDILAVFSDGGESENHRVDLCQVSDFTFHE